MSRDPAIEPEATAPEDTEVALPVEPRPALPDPVRADFERAMSVVRELEVVADLAREVRRHLKRRPHRKTRARARRQLQRLRVVLDTLQRRLLAEGLSERGQHRINRELQPVQLQLEATLVHDPTKDSMRELRWSVWQARRLLEVLPLD